MSLQPMNLGARSPEPEIGRLPSREIQLGDYAVSQALADGPGVDSSSHGPEGYGTATVF